MSSLQEALNNAAKRLNLKKLHDGSKQKSQGDGAFENSFAQGLDISELLSTEAQPATSGAQDCQTASIRAQATTPE